METLEFYVVRSKDGKYLRAKGYSGYGDSWVTDLKKAKVYTKRQGATAQITYWANNYPEYGVPELVPLIATLGEPIPQEERVAKVQKKKELEKLKWELRNAERAVDEAKRDLEHSRGRNPIQTKYENSLSKLESVKNKIKELTEN